MKKRINFEEYLEEEFRKERKITFLNNKFDKMFDVVNPTVSETILVTIKDLKEIIYKNILLFRLIINTEPKQYNSITDLFNETKKYANIRNFTKKINEIDDIKNISEYYIDAVTNEKKDLSENPFQGSKEKYVCIRNTYSYIKSINISGTRIKKEYLFKTYSPYYTSFIFDNSNSVFAQNLTFIKFNSLVNIANKIHNAINESELSDTEKFTQKILFPYLAERGCGINYKFFMYQYVQLFLDELRNLNIDKESFISLIQEYILYFTKFRDLYIFYDERFFEKVHIIISLLLKARYQYVLDFKATFNGDAFYQMCQGKINKMLEDLFDYQNDLCYITTTDSSQLHLENYKLTFEKTFVDPTNRTSQHIDLWNQVQNYVNMHIDTDYNKTYFNILPQFNAHTYESKVVFNTYFKMQNLFNT